jgi:hypothetical protein
MRKFFGICVGAAALIFLPSAPAGAQTFTATLSGGEETPPVLTGAAGTVEVSVDTVNREFSVTLRVFNIPSNAPTTASHIHVGPKGPALSGPVVVDFIGVAGRTGDFALTFRVGQAQFHARPDNGIDTLDDMIQAILNGNAYVNVHTTAHPGGEIRGQLVPAAIH